MLDFNTLNTRLAACQLPGLTALHALPEGITLERIAHALEQAERGQNGARLYLQRQLSNRPAAAPPPSPAPPTPPTVPTPARSAAPRPAATSNAGMTVPTPPSQHPTQTPTTPARSAAPHPAATPNTGMTEVKSPPAGLAPRATSASARPDRVQCRVYGGKAALCIETDVTRQDEPTLRLEAAPATGPRAYNWERKITLQLTREELPVVTATVLGLLARCVYKNHGPDHNKGVEIEHQGGHLFVRLFQKDRGVLAVPVGPADSYSLAALALRALRQGTPGLSDQGILMLLKLTVQRMGSAAQNVKQ